jgi:hypothetical protein
MGKNCTAQLNFQFEPLSRAKKKPAISFLREITVIDDPFPLFAIVQSGSVHACEQHDAIAHR